MRQEVDAARLWPFVFRRGGRDHVDSIDTAAVDIRPGAESMVDRGAFHEGTIIESRLAVLWSWLRFVRLICQGDERSRGRAARRAGCRHFNTLSSA